MSSPFTIPRCPPIPDSFPAAPRAHSPTIEALEKRAKHDPRAIDRFWTTLGRTPLVEYMDQSPDHALVTFLYEDLSAECVLVNVNKVTSSPSDGKMCRVAESGLWAATFILDRAWRGSYGFVSLGAKQYEAMSRGDRFTALRALRQEARFDPKNPDSEMTFGGHTASVAYLDRAQAQKWIESPSPDNVRGSMSPGIEISGRTVWLYTPPGAGETEPAPCVVMLDGDVWRTSKNFTYTADNLALSGFTRPAYFLLVDSQGTEQRLRDLAIDGNISSYVVFELLPWAREHLPIAASVHDTVVVGQSLGGLSALKIALDHPDYVGNAVAQSSSLWQCDMLDRASQERTEANIWLEVGAYEPVLLPYHPPLVSALRSSGATVHYREYVGGHDMACWRGGIGDALAVLLGGKRRNSSHAGE